VRPTLAFALFAALLMTAPAARAGWFSKTTIHVAPYRVGDVLRYEEASRVVSKDGKAETESATHVAAVERRLAIPDPYGEPRPVTAIRVDLLRDGKLNGSVRFHVLDGSNLSLRTDTLYGQFTYGFGYSAQGQGVAGVPVTGGWSYSQNTTWLSTFNTSVWDLYLVRPATLSEGDRVPVEDLFPGMPRPGALSAPAEATTFHGHDAILLRYDVAQLFGPEETNLTGELRLVLADGLPGLVKGEVDAEDLGEGSRETGSWELAGYSPGSGEAMPAYRGVTLRGPAAGPYEALSLDTRALPVDYRFDDALANLKADPQMGLASWLRQHPAAQVLYAGYDRLGSSRVSGAQDTDGGWGVTLVDGRETRSFYSSREGAAAGAASRLPDALRNAPGVTVHDFDDGGSRVDAAPGVPAGLVAPADALRAALAQGLDASSIKGISFALGSYHGQTYAVWTFSEVGSQTQSGTEEGRMVFVDAITGAATGIASTRRTVDNPGLIPLGAAAADLPGSGASTLSALAGPGLGAGLAGGAALTGLALLALLVKFLLVPLFTRLRRDGLLENATRARLYERIRAEPGIHLAELVDFTGIGEGATRHHVDQLVKHRFVTRLDEEGFVRFYAAGEVPPDVARREALLRAGSMRGVYDLYAREPRLTLREAGARLGLSAPSVHRCKKRLEKAGLLPAATEARVAAAAAAEA